MKAVGIAELKAKLSESLRRVKRGERVVVEDRGTPVAELRPIEGQPDRLSIRPARTLPEAVVFPATGKGESYTLEDMHRDRRGQRS